jgi:hypothetical protein
VQADGVKVKTLFINDDAGRGLNLHRGRRRSRQPLSRHEAMAAEAGAEIDELILD